MTNTRDICKSIFLLHALGDTIGFKNAIWEFNYNDYNMSDIRVTIEIISEFIALGGITNIDLSGWHISDDTLLNYEIAKFVLDLKIKETINDDNINKLKKQLQNFITKEIKSNIERGYGSTTIKSIEKFTDKIDERSEPYNSKSGGNGCSMRTLSIGIRFHKDEDLDKLINVSIITSKITHNSPIGFLGGLATAYFVKLALNKVDITDWPFMLIELYQSKEVKKYIDIDNDNIYFDYRNCIKVWKEYISLFFDEKTKKPLNLKTSINLLSRFKIIYDLNEIMSTPFTTMGGGNGQTAVIMAYNSLLDCNGIWEKLVYYGMLHGGDSDTVGAIAGGLYGAVYGSKDISDNLLKHLEMKDKLIEIGEKYYDNYL